MWSHHQNWKRFIHLAYCLRNTVDDLDDIKDLDDEKFEQDVTDGWQYEMYLERHSLRLLDGIELSSSADRGRLVLECAIGTRSRVLVEAVMDLGVDVNKKDELGRTPLHFATLFSKIVDIREYYKILISIEKLSIAKYQLAASDFAATSDKALRGIRNGVLEVLLARGADVNAVDNYGWAPIHLAVVFGSDAAVTSLLNHGADVNLKTYFNQTLLHCASMQPCGVLVESSVFHWLEKKVTEVGAVDGESKTSRVFHLSGLIDVNAKDDVGNTALHYSASLNCSRGFTEDLVKNGADIRIKNNDGKTALQVALQSFEIYKNTNGCVYKNIETIYVLLNGEIKLSSGENNEQLDPLTISFEPIHVENHFENALARLVLKNEDNTMLTNVNKYKAIWGLKGDIVVTLLHIATLRGDIKMVKLVLLGNLITKQCNRKTKNEKVQSFCYFINTKTHSGWSPAIAIAAMNGHCNIVSLFLDIASFIDEYIRFDVDGFDKRTKETCKIDTQAVNSYGHSLLTGAVLTPNYDMAKLLSNYGSLVNYQEINKGYSSLHFLFAKLLIYRESLDYKMIDLLLCNGADVNLQEKRGFTALHMAVLREMDSTEKYVVDHFFSHNCLDPNYIDKRVSKLDQERSFKDVVGLLLRYGANINVQSNNGETALHTTINLELPEVVKMQRKGKSMLCDDFSFELISSTDDAKMLSSIGIGKHDGTIEEKIKFKIFQPLLVEDADLYNKKDNKGLSVVEAALSKGYLNIFKLLTRDRADINRPDDEGCTVLMLLVRYRCFDLIQKELDAGADLTKKDKKGFTALHYARSGCIVDLLLSKGAEIHAKSNDGSIPLHCALREIDKCDEDCLDAFFVSSSIYICDNEGKTARDYCIEQRYSCKIRKLLKLYNMCCIMEHLNDILPSWPTKRNMGNKMLRYYKEIQSLKKSWLRKFGLKMIFNYSLTELSFTKNSDLISFLESGEFDRHFEHINNFVKRRFAQAKRMNEMLDEVSALFSHSLFHSLDLNIPSEVCRMILEKTNPPDLINLRYAFQLD